MRCLQQEVEATAARARPLVPQRSDAGAQTVGGGGGGLDAWGYRLSAKGYRLVARLRCPVVGARVGAGVRPKVRARVSKGCLAVGLELGELELRQIELSLEIGRGLGWPATPPVSLATPHRARR